MLSLAHIPLILNNFATETLAHSTDICEFFLFYFSRILFALFERAHGFQNARLLTEDPQSLTPSQDQCLCQLACKHLHTVHPTGSAQRGFRRPQELRRKFTLENTVCFDVFLFLFLNFKCIPNPLPLTSRYI